ncbi:BUB3-interacting and GLEBS motif-containing protein [Lachnellula subtilissima]|uniref:BUB3-interacting and GLEBS motif-containing protein n=1 Tax=Lachnellula subtilissima TaxID=602034 RepID=A0A8H8RGL9_9HELO|nr:BUB3-interacting and GLEBS motif-containing protein [Lachnellula subtilissima]
MVGKKKRGHPDVEELLSRPWCYYCERDFDDLKILISHQKAKHFKCERCGRRLNTAGGLSVHMNQVHKETLTMVDNSLPNRQGLEVEIFGMEGIPEDVSQAHNQRIIAGFYQAEAERRATTGNPGPGGNQGNQSKKPKFESPTDLKKRLAEHKARKEAEKAGTSSGGNTPMVEGVQNSPLGQSPSSFVRFAVDPTHAPELTTSQNNASPYIAPQATHGASQGAGYGSFSQEPYSQPAAAYQQPYASQPPFSGPPGAQFQPQYSPPQQYPPSQSFPPPGFQPPGQNYPSGPPSFGAGSPPPGSFNGYHGPPSNTPPAHGGLPNRPPSLPPAPGLPQRPSFGAPQVPPYQMQQLHQGPPGTSFQGQQGSWTGNSWKGQDQKPAMSSSYPPHSQGYGDYSTNASSVDDLVSGAAREADDIDEIIRMAEAVAAPPVQATEAEAKAEATSASVPESAEIGDKSEPTQKKSKKDKPQKMIYSDNEMSPEEKMALMPRYAFVPDGKTETSLVDAATIPGVASTVDA